MSNIVLVPGGLRVEQLMRLAYEEEGRSCPDIDERLEPATLLFPRSFVDRVDAMSGDKVHDYCFMGSVYRPETYEPRSWILDFARRRFTERSYLLVSEAPEHHTCLGSFDHTGDQRDVFVPKAVPPRERAFFNAAYFRVLRSSQFTLCPAGDLPWSLRFFEAIMCRSIPIVADLQHVGRNALERAIGYRVLLRDDEHIYDEEVAEENHQRFLRHQTLIDDGRVD